MTVPSVKGAMIMPMVVLIRRGRDSGHFSEDVLARLSPRTCELLDERVQLAQWYPMECFSEMLDLDWDVNGGRDPDYMRRSGERSASVMAKNSRYQQLDYVQRKERPKSTSELISQVRMTSSVTLSYYNFMKVNVQMHPRQPHLLQIIYTGTDPFPEPLRYSTEGFMNGLNRLRGSTRSWSSERAGDTIVFSLETKPMGSG